MAETEELFLRPMHPHTEALLSAVPAPDPGLRGKKERIVLQHEVADPSNPPSGCYFHPRCAYAQERCQTEKPALREVTPGRYAACHFAEQVSLRGVVAEGQVG